MFFGFLKKNKNKEVTGLTTDEKEIKEAREDISEAGEDSQTDKDRIDESVGEQEKRSRDENSQNAKDRVDESEGAKNADEDRAEEKKDEGKGDGFKALVDEVHKVVEALPSMIAEAVKSALGNETGREPQETSSDETKTLDALRGIYD